MTTSPGCADQPAMSAEAITVSFHVRGREPLVALSDVSLTVGAGESVGLVGESGSGKSTLARTLLGLVRPAAGTVKWHGTDVATLRRAELKRRRAAIGVVFQDPFDALNPQWTVLRNIVEPMLIHHAGDTSSRTARAEELLATVHLDAGFGHRYPHQLSGGQAQRVGIARALATRPSVVVLDEPTSALDASVRGQIITLLTELRTTLGLSYLYISHDLPSVRSATDRVVVLYRGSVLETNSTQELFEHPSHDYTKALLEAQLPLSLTHNACRLHIATEVPE